jgi:hypothetical protein
MNHQVISKSSKSFAGSENPWIIMDQLVEHLPKKTIQKPDNIASVGARCIVVVDFASAPRLYGASLKPTKKNPREKRFHRN